MASRWRLGSSTGMATRTYTVARDLTYSCFWTTGVRPAGVAGKLGAIGEKRQCNLAAEVLPPSLVSHIHRCCCMVCHSRMVRYFHAALIGAGT